MAIFLNDFAQGVKIGLKLILSACWVIFALCVAMVAPLGWLWAGDMLVGGLNLLWSES